MLDDDDDYLDVDIDKLVEMYQASAGAPAPPGPHPQSAPTHPQHPHLHLPKQFNPAPVHLGSHAHIRPLQPANNVQQQWQQGYQLPAPTHGLPGVHGQAQGPTGVQYCNERATGGLSHQHQNGPPPPGQQQCPQSWWTQQQPKQQHPQHCPQPQHGASVTALPVYQVMGHNAQQPQGQGLPNPLGQQQQAQQQYPPPLHPLQQHQPAPQEQHGHQPRQDQQQQQQRQVQQRQQPLSHGASVVAFPAHQDRRVPEQHHVPPAQQQQATENPQPQGQQQRQQQQPLHHYPPQQQQPGPQGLPLPAGQQQLQQKHPLPLQHHPHPLQQKQQPPGPQGVPPPGQQQSLQQPQFQQMLQQKQQPPPKPTTAANPAAAPPRSSVTFTATLSLEEDKRFAVKVGFHEGLKAVFNLITGASAYDNMVKGWTFPLSQYKHVMEALTDGRLRTRGVQLTMQQVLPEFVNRMLHAVASRPNDERLYDKLTRRPHDGEQSLDEKMMPFQREGVRYGLKMGGRVLIGDEMGLGKTVQACCLLKCYSEDWPALVVVPKSLRETWADALFMWLKLTDEDVFVVNNLVDVEKLRGKQPAVKPSIIVVSYDTLSRKGDELHALKLKMVVLDEAHYIKNGKAQRTKAALPLIQQAKRAVLLTGTPALSRPAELVPLLQAIVPSATIKATEFGERYSVPDRRYPGKFFGSRNESELNKLLQPVMVRRLKKDVLTHLPPKRRQQVFVRLPDDDMRKLGKMGRELEGIKAVADSMMSTGGGSAMAGVCREQQQTIMRLWRDTAALKAEAVAEYCADLLEADGAKFLLFAHHRVLLDRVEAKVKSCKARYIRIDGSTSSIDRSESVKLFQEDADVKVAILSIQAAGVGLTLTASSLVVFAELSWVPGDIQQAEDRCHRIGQHTSVNIHFLLVKSSIDEIMWDTLQNKLGNVGKVLDGSGASIQVDETREVRGLGASAAAARPPLNGGAGGAGASPVPADRPGPAAGDAQRSPLPGGAGGLTTSRGANAGGQSGSARTAGKATAAAAGTRRISDFFAPGGTAVGGAAGKANDGGNGGPGQKRGREPPDEVELLSDGDDFKRR